MSESLYNSKSYLQLDEDFVCEFGNILNENEISPILKSIESFLIDVPQDKVDDIIKIMIEILENIVKYSANRVQLSNNKYQSQGTFVIIADTQTNTYTIQSSSLVDVSQKELLLERLKEVNGLDEAELRKLLREKMRTRRDNHEKGAGLGFLIIALRVLKPIQIKFIPYNTDMLEYILKLEL